jgi:hypothetical protein
MSVEEGIRWLTDAGNLLHGGKDPCGVHTPATGSSAGAIYELSQGSICRVKLEQRDFPWPDSSKEALRRPRHAPVDVNKQSEERRRIFLNARLGPRVEVSGANEGPAQGIKL